MTPKLIRADLLRISQHLARARGADLPPYLAEVRRLVAEAIDVIDSASQPAGAGDK